MSDLHIGTSYKGVLDLEKRIECAVVDRMSETGGYCLQEFIRKGQSLFFAVDNIDFLEATCDGQNTLHGTVIVVNQTDSNKGERINEKLKIPGKATPIERTLTHRKDFNPDAKPLKFSNIVINSRQ